MSRNQQLVILSVLGFLLVGTVRARPAAAFDATPIIIGASVAGGVALIAGVAILASSDDDEEDKKFMLPPPLKDERASAQGVSFVTSCTQGANLTLACW